MATTRNARAHWEGTLFEGQGTVELTSSGIGTFPITWASRAESADGTHQSRGADRRGARVVLLDGALQRSRQDRQSR